MSFDASSIRALLLEAKLFVGLFELYSSGHSVYSDYYFIRWSLIRILSEAILFATNLNSLAYVLSLGDLLQQAGDSHHDGLLTTWILAINPNFN